jgi:hypothetical protein
MRLMSWFLVKDCKGIVDYLLAWRGNTVHAVDPAGSGQGHA